MEVDVPTMLMATTQNAPWSMEGRAFCLIRPWVLIPIFHLLFGCVRPLVLPRDIRRRMRYPCRRRRSGGAVFYGLDPKN